MNKYDKQLLKDSIGHDFECQLLYFSGLKTIRFTVASVTNSGFKSKLFVAPLDKHVEMYNKKTQEFEKISLYRINYLGLLDTSKMKNLIHYKTIEA